jgi:excisionase family DNA binding protein
MPEFLDVREAAHRLGVSPVRVRQLIAQGDLDASRLGRFWVIDRDSVRRRAQADVDRGRPYSSRQVWRMAVMADLVLADDADALRRFVDPQARWRLRRYLADLAREDDPRNVAWRLRGRADQLVRRFAHPSVVAPLVEDPRCVVSGAHGAVAHGADLVPDDLVDAYVAADDRNDLDADYGLIDAGGDANVRLRVIDGPVMRQRPEGRSAPAAPGHVAPRLLVVADLADRDDARAKFAGQALWSSLRDGLEALPA